MAKRHDDTGADGVNPVLPWPDDDQGRSLARFDSTLWREEIEWRFARLRVAGSLNRPALPEARATVRVKRTGHGPMRMVRR